uniref:Uncharacterized protein n=1 Tax=Panagrolaimus sp. JU765 TaxID=591449 RepID=A0AC34QX90_9BILA
MKYFLTVPLEKGIDFLNLNQLLDKLELGQWMAYQIENGYKPSMYCTPKQCKRIQLLEKAKRIVTVPINTDLDDLIGKPYTVTFDAYNYDYAPNDVNIVDKNKDHLFIRDNTIAVEMLGYAVSKNLTRELEQINRAISRFFPSYSNVRARYTNPMYQYRTEDLKDGAVTLTLLHMNILFYMYLALIAASILSLGVELLHFRYNWRSDGKSTVPRMTFVLEDEL